MTDDMTDKIAVIAGGSPGGGRSDRAPAGDAPRRRSHGLRPRRRARPGARRDHLGGRLPDPFSPGRSGPGPGLRRGDRRGGPGVRPDRRPDRGRRRGALPAAGGHHAREARSAARDQGARAVPPAAGRCQPDAPHRRARDADHHDRRQPAATGRGRLAAVAGKGALAAMARGFAESLAANRIQVFGLALDDEQARCRRAARPSRAHDRRARRPAMRRRHPARSSSLAQAGTSGR